MRPRLHPNPFWDGFWSIFYYMGGLICLAPFWDADW